MATNVALEKGKLYRVKALHPEEVHEPGDMCFYPAEILPNGRQSRNLRGSDGQFMSLFLHVGDIVLYLGALNGMDKWSWEHSYSTIIFGEKVYASNASIDTTHRYYEFERVGCAL